MCTHRPDYAMMSKEEKLLSLYLDLEWISDDLLMLSKVDSTSNEYKCYESQKEKISDFYNDPNNDRLTLFLNESQ